MTEYELDKIKKSFVRSNAKCPVEVACLLTVIKYYNGKETDIHTLTEWCKINGKLTLAGMKQGAIYSGMKAEICLQNIHQLTQRKLPIILFTLNDFNVPGYVVCYGIHESRFIIWEPEFGLMQYWADEMKTLWIKGIALTLFPTQDFMNSANLHLKWWEIYSWSKLWKRKVEHWYEYIWLNVPLTLSKILCKWKQDSAVSLFLYLDSVFKNKHKLIHNQAPVMNRLCPFLLNLHK